MISFLAIVTDSPGVVYYASIAHGNQSVNRAGDIGAHIYDSQANTGITRTPTTFVSVRPGPGNCVCF